MSRGTVFQRINYDKIRLSTKLIFYFFGLMFFLSVGGGRYGVGSDGILSNLEFVSEFQENIIAYVSGFMLILAFVKALYIDSVN